jgi:hypothetical protein
LLLLSGAGIVWACADIEGDDSSAFAPEYFVNKHYSPFFYDGYNRYYEGADSSQIIDNNTRYNKLVSGEWKTFLGAQLSSNQVDFLLFKAKPKQVDSVEKLVSKNFDGRGKTFFNYLPLVKDCESFTVNTQDYWYQKVPAKIPPAALEKRINTALSTYHDQFIRERLWFQLVRYHYFQDTTGKKAIPTFYKYEKEFPHNLMYYRTLGYLAGAEYAEKNYALANYHYSLCYNYTWQMYIPSQWSFHPQEEADWKQTLKLAKTPEEKITLWHLLGIDHDPGRAIREIVKINPKSEKLDLLLSRLINSAEGSSLTPSINKADLHYQAVLPFTNNAAAVRAADSINDVAYRNAYNKAFAIAAKHGLADDKDLRLIDSISNLKQIGKPYFWHMASGYLHYMHADYKAAKSYYLITKQELPANNKEIAAQYKLLNILLSVNTINHINAQTEAQLVEPLTWLADLRDNKQKVRNLRFTNALQWVTDTLGGMYRNQHDRIKANCFKTVPHIYTDSVAIDAIEKLMTKVNKTPFEKVMLRYYPVKLNQLYYQQALLVTYDGNIKAAIKFMEKADSLNKVNLPANPFNSRLNDCHDCEFGESTKNYSPLKFLRTIQTLKDNLQAGRDKYNSALLLGGAFYNITHFGNSRAFFQNDLTSYSSQPEYYDDDYRGMFTSTEMAEKYYTIALQNASSNEQKAKCAFLLSKCERNKYYNEHPNKDSYGPDPEIPPAGKWFKELKSKYTATDYYKEVLKECGYFKKYAEK